MIGKTVAHYKILEKIGKGGMGVVYKAEDTKLKRTVALKFLPPDLTRDPEANKRFIQEAQAASALDHANICTIHEINETHDGQMFICMAYYEGESLQEKIERGPLKLEEALNFAIQTAEGLQEAHQKGIVHRDIKPANIMVTLRGQVKIMDFGLAKLASQTKLTKVGTTLGTAAYMSPEQARGEVVDYRTDIWSLGVVLHEMLTGGLPFKGEYEQAVVYSILNEDPPPLTTLRQEVSVELDYLVNKALAKQPGERYKTADGLKTALTKVKKALEIKAVEEDHSESSKPSIAVLPFTDLSAEKDQEYFCDGMAEEIINALTHVEGLHVVARTSAFAFKDKCEDIREIGKKLNVKTLLEGSVRKSDNRLRIVAQLVNVADGYHLWSEKYDRKMDDIFAVQDEISLEIVNKLKIKLAAGEKTLLTKRYTEDLEAYNLYLKGRWYWNKFTEKGFKRGIEYFQRAIEKDPTYALAYAGIADCHIWLGWYNYLLPKEEFPRAKAVAEKALEIDDNLSEAHTSLAWIRMSYDWEWSSAESEFKRAIELNPGYANAHFFYSVYLAAMGRHDESIVEAKRAQVLDPLALMISANLGMRFYYARQYDRAIEQFQRTLEMDANYVVAHLYMAFPCAQKGIYNEAITKVQKAIELLGKVNSLFLASLGLIYSLSGDHNEAKKVLNELLELSKQEYVSSFFIALLYVGLNQKNKAFEWLEKAYGGRDHMLVWLKVEPILDSLRSDKRYIALLKRMGLDK